MAPLAEALASAAALVARVAAGRSLSAELQRVAEEGADSTSAERGALADLCYGTLRRYGRSQAIVAALSRRAGAADPLVEALLWCAFYALESGRYADYTVVDQAARACASLRREGAKGYVNALLRGFLRARPMLRGRLAADPVAQHQHPAWWIERVRAAYPAGWEQVLAAGNMHPPMCLRVNARRITTDAYALRLAAEGIQARRIGALALLLERPLPVDRLPGFAGGEVSVQDSGAQRAAGLLDLQAGQRVLDACAAPGGKTAHLLELADLELVAADIDAERLRRVAENLSRLSLQARLLQADAERLEPWREVGSFERILADVPCTASGVVRRHPDIKWLRKPADIAALVGRQAHILDTLWQLLGGGGKLLYATCSVFHEENSRQIEQFIARHADARQQPLPLLAEGIKQIQGQLLPDAAHDGFFYALLEKV